MARSERVCLCAFVLNSFVVDKLLSLFPDPYYESTMIAPDITTATDASVVHKRQSGGSGRKGHPQAKRQRRVSPESKAPNCTTVPMEVEPVFPKLDPSNPVHANRILQRRKAVQKGKNTAGYTRYVENVPKETRRPRSMETPLTPDHTLDIPTKRWQGLLRAW